MVRRSYSHQKKALEAKLLEAHDLIVLGIFLGNATEYVGFFQEMRHERSTGKAERPGVDLSSFTGWLATRHHWQRYRLLGGLEPGEIASTNHLVIFRGSALQLPQDVHEAESLIEERWLPRLPGLLDRFNGHPLTTDLPDAELDVKGGAKFVVRFAG